MPPGTVPIPPPSTVAQCFVKPSWADHPLPCPRSVEGTPGPSLLTFKASVLGALTWRVMEEVDNTLLRGVEEGSGHGVVLSISTEKLKRQDKKELEVAGKVGGMCQRGGSSGQGGYLRPLGLQLCLHWRASTVRFSVPNPAGSCLPAEPPRLRVAPTLNAALQHVLPAGDMPRSSPGWAGNLLSSKS